MQIEQHLANFRLLVSSTADVHLNMLPYSSFLTRARLSSCHRALHSILLYTFNLFRLLQQCHYMSTNTIQFLVLICRHWRLDDTCTCDEGEVVRAFVPGLKLISCAEARVSSPRCVVMRRSCGGEMAKMKSLEWESRESPSHPMTVRAAHP